MRYQITKNGQHVSTTRNDITWCQAVYPAAEGYEITPDKWVAVAPGPCTCIPGSVCDYCYGQAYAGLYNR